LFIVLRGYNVVNVSSPDSSAAARAQPTTKFRPEEDETTMKSVGKGMRIDVSDLNKVKELLDDLSIGGQMQQE
jgi:hypothetical protein